MFAWRIWRVKEAVTQMQDELRVGKHFKTRIPVRREFWMYRQSVSYIEKEHEKKKAKSGDLPEHYQAIGKLATCRLALRLHRSNAAAAEAGKMEQRVEFPGEVLMGLISPSPSIRVDHFPGNGPER
jgi:hypothetical protein